MSTQTSIWRMLWWIVEAVVKFLLLLLFALTTLAEMLLTLTNQVLKDVLKIN